jgi:hypothetical protein
MNFCHRDYQANSAISFLQRGMGNAMGARVLLPLGIMYALAFLLTAGSLHRAESSRGFRIEQIICATIWPIWWPIACSFGSFLDAIDNAALGTDRRSLISLAIGLFAAGHFLSSIGVTAAGSPVAA